MKLDEEAFKECMEEQAMKEQEIADRYRQQEKWERNQLYDQYGIDYYMDMEEEPYNRVIP